MAETTTDYSAILEQLGLNTADAIKAWQKEYGLDQTGEWGEAEQAAYDTYGSLPYKTADAIKQYQLSRGLSATGKWGSAEDAAYRKDQAAGGVLADVNSIVQKIMAEYDLPSTDTDTLKAQIEAYLRPSADQAIAARNKATAANRAAIDLDAYSRGMGASTWVTDAKQRETDSALDDIGTIESNYMATLSEAILNQLNAAKNAQLTAQTNAYNLAAQLYQMGQNAAAGVGGGSGGGGGGGGGYSYSSYSGGSSGGGSSSSSSGSSRNIYDSTNLTNDGKNQSFSNKDNLYSYLGSSSAPAKTGSFIGADNYGKSSSNSSSSSGTRKYDSSTLSNSKWA